MASDGGADVVDLHPPVELREALFHQRRNGTGVRLAGGMADVALAGVAVAALGVLLHAAHAFLYDPGLAADLVPGDQAAQVVHVEQGADVQRGAEPARGLRDAAALDIVFQRGREKPVVQPQLVVLRPAAEPVHIVSLVPQVRQPVHQKAVAGGGAQGIDNIYLPLRVALPHDARRVHRRVPGAGDARREADVQDVAPLRRDGLKIIEILRNADLRGLCIGALRHQTVKLREGDRLAQVIRVLHAVQAVVEADVADAAPGKMLLRQVGGGAAA